mgnify:CR=1 FL=1
MKTRILTVLIALFAITAPAIAQQNDPVANPEAVVTSGNARFTVLTNRLIRMEWAEDGKWEDNASLAIINRNRSTDAKYQVGDACWGGSQLISLPNLSQMKVKININEVDISKVTKGLEALVSPDAYSDSVFHGRVTTIANLAVSKERGSSIKVFPVEVLLDEADENLLPGLTVSCRLIVDRIEDVDYVPLEGVFVEGDKSYVYRRSLSGYDKVEIETGATNNDCVIVTSGLRKGDHIALLDPTKVEEKKEEKSE